MSSILVISNLEHSFHDGNQSLQVLKAINLEISAAELVILSGPSGCGKTTLLSLVGGLRPIQQGRVYICGEELSVNNSRQRNRVRRMIGMIFQSHHLIGFLSAQENVQLAMQAPSRHRLGFIREQQTAIELLCEMDLEHKADSMIKHLSGGQRQRVAIARALACQPRLILADEPTASLDAVTGRRIMDLLRRISRDRGIAILMTSHDQRLYSYADRVIRIDDGRLS
jgi:putative ABC transport system ATP-binding protein